MKWDFRGARKRACTLRLTASGCDNTRIDRQFAEDLVGGFIREQADDREATSVAASRAISRRGFARSGIIWMACVLGGCGSGDGLDRQAISGIVNLDGRPLNDGTILLEPETNQSGTAVGATIRRGEFVVPKDQGPVPGSYRVRIYASAGKQDPPAPGQTEHTRRPMAELLPDVYNTRSVLRADVNARRANRFRFELRSDGQTDSTSHRGGSPPSSRPRLVFHHPGESPRWETGRAASP